MQLISGSVGERGTNAVHDAALVQAILVKTQRAASGVRPAAPYLASYDGVAGTATANAIKAFQADHVFVSANGQQAPKPRATLGQVLPNDATWEKLLQKVPAAFADMRVLTGGKTVYVAATAAQLQAKLAAVGNLTFTTAFRQKVTACINLMHTRHGIAIGVCPQGDRRTFQAQYVLRTSGRGVTNAGPGESNHNFGMACDLGFKGLRWLRANGTVVEHENEWLRERDSNATESNKFWAALRTAGTDSNMFRGPVNDRPHLQNWNDAGVVMAVRLADLLTRSGTMRWTGQRGVYSCDLGLGGALVPVGSAVDIWNNAATVSVAELQQLRAAARPPVPGPVNAAAVLAMQQALRAQFDLADANWQAWTPN
jgi:hypothetical protein